MGQPRIPYVVMKRNMPLLPSLVFINDDDGPAVLSFILPLSFTRCIIHSSSLVRPLLPISAHGYNAKILPSISCLPLSLMIVVATIADTARSNLLLLLPLSSCTHNDDHNDVDVTRDGEGGDGEGSDGRAATMKMALFPCDCRRRGGCE